MANLHRSNTCTYKITLLPLPYAHDLQPQQMSRGKGLDLRTIRLLHLVVLRSSPSKNKKGFFLHADLSSHLAPGTELIGAEDTLTIWGELIHIWLL